jgi:glycosyltransferase involved in cell wall biosynthesis
VLPSRDEALPISMMEAMHYAKPMIVTDVGGIAEVVEHGENGMVVAAEDAQAMAASITALVRDGALMERIGRNAQAKFDHYLTMERFGTEVRDVLTHVVQDAL